VQRMDTALQTLLLEVTYYLVQSARNGRMDGRHFSARCDGGPC
jgi:hypothetical protein